MGAQPGADLLDLRHHPQQVLTQHLAHVAYVTERAVDLERPVDVSVKRTHVDEFTVHLYIGRPVVVAVSAADLELADVIGSGI